MKAIFLDIDGVLNSSKTPNPRKFPYVVDKRLLSRFKALVARTGATVVLSSTWRYDPAGLFSARHWGIPFEDTIPDTPGVARREEICAWLRTHPQITRYAVIDDEDDELDDLPLFQPSPTTGLTEEICAGVAVYLSGKTDKDMRRSKAVRIFQNAIALMTFHRG
jgi:hypothetical protein